MRDIFVSRRLRERERVYVGEEGRGPEHYLGEEYPLFRAIRERMHPRVAMYSNDSITNHKGNVSDGHFLMVLVCHQNSSNITEVFRD